MSVLTIDTPPGGATGDTYLLHVRSEIRDYEPSVSVAGFAPFAQTGKAGTWDRLFVRAHDGTEPATFDIAGLGASNPTPFAQAQCLIVRGHDVLTLADSGTVLNINDELTPSIDAVTTTVDESLILVGLTTWDWNEATGPQITSGPTAVEVLRDDHLSITIWSAEAATAGAHGPWVLDRTGELVTTDVGGSWWSVIAAPIPLDPLPTVEGYTVTRGFVEADAVAATPDPVMLTGPHGETVWIQEATQAAQDAAIAAQLAEWAAVTDAETFGDAVADYITGNAAWLAGDTSGSDPQLVEIVEQVTAYWRSLGP